MDLSIIIVSYNTSVLTTQCIDTLSLALMSSLLKWEIIVVDNASTDDSVVRIQEYANDHQVPVKIMVNRKNNGFGAANNLGVEQAGGKYILLLNSDTIINNLHFDDLMQFVSAHPDMGIMSIRLMLPDGSMDPACHRGFPTLWRSFCYLTGIEKTTERIPFLNQITGGYHLTHLPLNTAHEIETPSGAFFLMKKIVFESVGGFDEQFFMYGEDVDLAFRVKKNGYKNWYYPKQSITHIKGQSGLKQSLGSQKNKQVNEHFYRAMGIFFNKHYAWQYPQLISQLVHMLLDWKIRKLQQPTTP
jgi:GT2 family glycosyltransferase